MPKIVIDAGHGGNAGSDREFYGNAYYENEGRNNYRVSQEVARLLTTNYDCVVDTTRDAIAEYPELNERGIIKGDCFVSIHSNAYNGKVKGTECYYSNKDSRSKALAALMSDRISQLLNTYNRGAKENPNYRVINDANKVGTPIAVLLEMGFHDNPTEAKKLTDKWQEISVLIADSIATVMKLEPKMVEEPTAKATPKQDPVDGPYSDPEKGKLWFRPIAGSQSTRQEAEKIKEELIKLGFSGAWVQAVYVK